MDPTIWIPHNAHTIHAGHAKGYRTGSVSLLNLKS